MGVSQVKRTASAAGPIPREAEFLSIQIQINSNYIHLYIIIESTCSYIRSGKTCISPEKMQNRKNPYDITLAPAQGQHA